MNKPLFKCSKSWSRDEQKRAIEWMVRCGDLLRSLGVEART